jgi:hypothetical protein
LILTTIALLLLAINGRADGIASAQAQASTGYATPQAALVPQAAPSCSYGAAALQSQVYVPQQQAVVIQRQVIPQAVYVPQAAIVQRQVYAAPVVQQAIVTPYVPQAQALAQVNSYGVGAAQLNRGLVLNRGVRGGAQRTVSRSKAVTVTGRAGFINRVLGR